MQLRSGETALFAGDRFVAFFEADEAEDMSGDIQVDNAKRAAACVNACDGMENPLQAVQTLRADSGYLSKYRDAYCAGAVRQADLLSVAKALRAEAQATRKIITLGEGNVGVRMYADMASSGEVEARETALRDARDRVDQLGALTVAIEQREMPDLRRFKGLDVRNVQLLLGAVEQLLASETRAEKPSARTTVDLSAIARLTAVLIECTEAPEVRA